MAEREVVRSTGNKPALFQVTRPNASMTIEYRIDSLTSEVNRILVLMSTDLDELRRRIKALEEKK